METESPKDKLLKACGVPSVPGQDQESRKYLQAETASSRTHQAQDETDKNYRRLNDYIRNELPGHLVKAYQEVTKNQVAATMGPLVESLRSAASEIESYSKENIIAGELRQYVIAIVVGLFTVLVGGCMVRCSFFGDENQEAKRYEMLGRQVTARINHSSPQERERILQWVDGGSLDPPGGKVRREKTGK